ncbi:hypothetical protein BpHYR1_014615 [Brachionus plicatilis]|uniref:Secreted protein n=1 Tax=Brachionus plicatilis TaxID=10195 RepID=A0A3M7QHW8_BRAPC|nr:hypothetical protein BpHYR1_014615 [Brachionus plicatilis]
MSSVLIFVFSGWVLANVWTNMVGCFVLNDFDSEREHTVLDFGEDECFVYVCFICVDFHAPFVCEVVHNLGGFL